MFCIFASIILAIFLNWKYKINMGLVSVAAAYLIGCFMLGLSPATLKGYIPIKVVFPMVAVTMFYGFAMENGTLQVLVGRLLRRNNKGRIYLPILFYVLCVGLGLIGLDGGSVGVIMGPVCMTLAAVLKVDPVSTAVAVMMGVGAGGNYMFAYGGNIARGLIAEVYEEELAMQSSITAFRDCIIVFTILFLIVFVLRLKSYKAKNALLTAEQMEEDAVLLPKQKMTLILIGAVVFFISVPTLISLFLPGTAIAVFAKRMDIGFLALVGALIASCMDLADTAAVITKRIPWKIVIMICGISVLMGVATECGLIEMLCDLLNKNISTSLIPAVLVLIAGVMSLFSSAISVVIPTMFPIVPILAASTSLSPELLYSSIVLGSALTGSSPFSTGGSLIVSSVPDGDAREEMIYNLLFVALSGVAFGAIYILLFTVL